MSETHLSADSLYEKKKLFLSQGHWCCNCLRKTCSFVINTKISFALLWLYKRELIWGLGKLESSKIWFRRMHFNPNFHHLTKVSLATTKDNGGVDGRCCALSVWHVQPACLWLWERLQHYFCSHSQVQLTQSIWLVESFFWSVSGALKHE